MVNSTDNKSIEVTNMNSKKCGYGAGLALHSSHHQIQGLFGWADQKLLMKKVKQTTYLIIPLAQGERVRDGQPVSMYLKISRCATVSHLSMRHIQAEDGQTH